MTITSQSLLIAADAMARAERARAWLATGNLSEAHEFSLRLHWTLGASVPGYADVVEGVSKLIGEALPGFIAAAVKSIEATAIEAVRDLATPAEEPAPKISAAEAYGHKGPFLDVACSFAPETNGPCRGCTCWKRTRADCS